MVYNYTKTFFSERRAAEFASDVNGDVWSSIDCFGQRIYTVKWF